MPASACRDMLDPLPVRRTLAVTRGPRQRFDPDGTALAGRRVQRDVRRFVHVSNP